MKIVYLFGAGASYNSLPVYSNMPERIRFFLAIMEKVLKASVYDIPQLKKYKELHHEITFFRTPDTLAKKYYLSNDRDLKLFDLKTLMSAFFIFEQLVKVEEVSTRAMSLVLTGEFDSSKLHDDSFWSVLDPRYLSFFATICSKNKSGLELASNISVISWNYDLQFERAFEEFSNGNFNTAQEYLNVFPCLKEIQPNVTEDYYSKFNILKLNGTAGFYTEKTSGGDVFDPYFHTTNKETIDIIKDILFQTRKSHKLLLHFAWEDSEQVKNARIAANKIIKEAETVVVIGYSFPDFNRLIDKNIFMGERLKKIYVQDPYADLIIQKLDGVSKGLDKKAIPITETSNFYIPFEFWE